MSGETMAAITSVQDLMDRVRRLAMRIRFSMPIFHYWDLWSKWRVSRCRSYLTICMILSGISELQELVVRPGF